MTNAKRKSFKDQNKSGKAKSQEKRIIGYFEKKMNGVTICDLINDLGLLHQTVTGRITHLTDEGIIYVNGEKEQNNITYSTYSYVTDLEERERLMEQRKVEKYEHWLKSGLKNYAELMSNRLKNTIEKELV